MDNSLFIEMGGHQPMVPQSCIQEAIVDLAKVEYLSYALAIRPIAEERAPSNSSMKD